MRLLLPLAIVAGAIASGAIGAPATAAPPEKASLRAFADEVVPKHLAKHKLPGGAVSMVADGELAVTAGYGVESPTSGRPVDAEHTIFVPASIAKLVTATAVMQLVEQGKLDLHADVNQYLGFRIADTYLGRPVTAHHLLTHTAGFADRTYGTGHPTGHVPPLGTHVAKVQPERIRPPGTLAVYSNYGIALAGHLVETRSGQPFPQYVAEKIFAPLGMTRSTFVQPTPEELRAAVAPGHRLADGKQVVTGGALYGPMPPHGAGFRATAADLGRFMKAQLTGSLLKPETTRQLHARQFGNADGAAGMGYGFWEYHRGDQRLLVHRGGVPGYVSIMALMPDRGLGFYASFNGSGEGGTDAAWDLVNAFVDRFAPTPAAGPAASAPRSSDRYAGKYRAVLHGDGVDLGKMAGLTSITTVTAHRDGSLTTSGRVGHGAPTTRQWVPIEPGVFRERDGYRRIAFRADGRMATDSAVGPLEKLRWYQLPTLHLGVVGASLLLLIGSVVVLLLPGWRGGSRVARALGWTLAAAVVASARTLVALFANFDANQEAFFLGGSPLFTTLFALPLVALPLTAAVLVAAGLAWRRGWWTRARRVHYTAIGVAAVGYLAVAAHYNVLA